MTTPTYEDEARADSRRQATQRRMFQLETLFNSGGNLRCTKCQCEKHEATETDCADGWIRHCGVIMAHVRPLKAYALVPVEDPQTLEAADFDVLFPGKDALLSELARLARVKVEVQS